MVPKIDSIFEHSPLLVNPGVAKVFGTSEAIFLQQLEYWMGKDGVGKVVDNRKWVYNSTRAWQSDNFPFMSVRTITSVVKRLSESGVVLKRNDLNKHSYDRTNWYTIDYSALQEVAAQSIRQELPNGAIEQRNMEREKKAVTIPETTRDLHGNGLVSTRVAGEFIER